LFVPTTIPDEWGSEKETNEMVTFQAAATEYLASITPTHTPSTMRTYHRNFAVVLTPYFGAETELASITGEQVAAFHASDALQQKPNRQPRAEPTKNQITGLLRSFLRDAESRGLNPGVEFPDAPKRAPRVLLCAKCRGPVSDVAVPAVAPPAVVLAEPVEPAPSAEPGRGTPAVQSTTSKRPEKKPPAKQPAVKSAAKPASKRR
jgi:hypothetical protein